ncbi:MULTISPECIES: tetratricopeptide repeat protein, partial [unclassified Nitrospina]|uniref:tetratricopeptide repeat protein n=1 Tax=unclassified Nitrospina TaxID=2638683 RepID=UPI003F9D86C3
MSLIADSLKKAQKERDKDQSAQNRLRGSIFSSLSPKYQRALSLLGWILILAGGLITVLIPSANYKAEVKPLLLAKPPMPGEVRKKTGPETVSTFQDSQTQTGNNGFSKSEPVAVVAMNPNAPSPEPGGTKTQSGKGKNTPPSSKNPEKSGTGMASVISTSKQKQAPEEVSGKKGIRGTKKQKSQVSGTGTKKKTRSTTVQKSIKKSKPKPVRAIPPVTPDKEEVVAYEPFVKPESALEQVAALTEGLNSEARLEPESNTQSKKKNQTGPVSGESKLAQEVPVTDLIKENPKPPEMETQQTDQPEQETETIVTVTNETEQVVGDESISVVPNENDRATTEKMKTGFDPRSLDDKSRYFNIATFHHRNKDYFAALKYYEKAKRRDPTNARIHNNRALIYKEMGKPQQAIGELLQAVRLDSNYGKAYNNLGLIYYQMGDGINAVRYFEKATELDPANVESINNLAILYKQQRHYRRAELLYRKVINLEPRHPEGYYNLALLYEETGRLKDAIVYYNRFVELAASTRPALTM